MTLKAIQLRFDKLDQSPDKDRMRRVEIEPLAEHILELTPQTIAASEDLQIYRWLLEELRVSVFAQELGAKKKFRLNGWISFGRVFDHSFTDGKQHPI
jgi:ATP-dependent helicase HrpA